MKIYTKTGDQGETGLIGGARVAKDHPRVAAYGDVDELNASIGVALALAHGSALGELLLEIQRDLFALGAQLADPTAKIGEQKAKAIVDQPRVQRLEAAIDERAATLPPLTAFILPGGSPVGAELHLARTVCRRAERSAIALARSEPVDPIAIVYLNRLSDLLFVLARQANQAAGLGEEKW
jgi:cob(I)alamin adenosyltransferase